MKRQRAIPITLEQARLICEDAIDQAVEYYQAIPNDALSARSRALAQNEQNAARRFFFAENSNFGWMAKTIGADVEVLRAALLERGQPQPTEINPRKQQRDPGRTYGTFVDRAARAVA